MWVSVEAKLYCSLPCRSLYIRMQRVQYNTVRKDSLLAVSSHPTTLASP